MNEKRIEIGFEPLQIIPIDMLVRNEQECKDEMEDKISSTLIRQVLREQQIGNE